MISTRSAPEEGAEPAGVVHGGAVRQVLWHHAPSL